MFYKYKCHNFCHRFKSAQIFKFLCFKMAIFVCLDIFLGVFFTLLVTMADPHLKF